MGGAAANVCRSLLVARFYAGEGPREIAEDLGAKEDEVIEAIRWETTPLAA